MRTAAEFDNYKKRTAREKDDFYKMAVCETIAPILPVLDNLDRAISAAEAAEEGGSVLDGIKMIKKQFQLLINHFNNNMNNQLKCHIVFKMMN